MGLFFCLRTPRLPRCKTTIDLLSLCQNTLFTACFRNLLISPISSKVFVRSSPKYLTDFWATRLFPSRQIPILLDDVYGMLYAVNKDIWSSSKPKSLFVFLWPSHIQQQCYPFSNMPSSATLEFGMKLKMRPSLVLASYASFHLFTSLLGSIPSLFFRSIGVFLASPFSVPHPAIRTRQSD